MDGPGVVSVGLVTLAGVGGVQDGVDRYSTSTVHATGIPDGSPVSFFHVGRLVHPIAQAYFNVSADP